MSDKQKQVETALTNLRGISAQFAKHIFEVEGFEDLVTKLNFEIKRMEVLQLISDEEPFPADQFDANIKFLGTLLQEFIEQLISDFEPVDTFKEADVCYSTSEIVEKIESIANTELEISMDVFNVLKEKGFKNKLISSSQGFEPKWLFKYKHK